MDGLPPIKTVENPEHRLVDTVFLPAFLQDNEILMKNDPQYVDRLYASGEKLANALLEGDWTIFQGQFMSEFSYHRHTVDPFEIPRSWGKKRGYDWGFNAPACMLWIAKEPSTGRLYLYREFYEAGLTDPQQAERINDMTQAHEKFTFNFADPTVWNKKTTELVARSTYDVFLEHQIYLTKADNKQERKAARLRIALGDIHDSKPGLLIFKNCENVIMELESLMTDPNNPEKPMRDQQDHAYDALCYALTDYTAPSVMNKLRDFKRTVDSPYRNMEGI